MGRTVKVRVVPKAKTTIVEAFGEGLKVHLTAAPVNGKANKALIEALAGFYGVKRSKVRIIKGIKSKDKTVLVNL
jgi:uncharacterized protein (TIGR00251 family)